VCFAGGTAVNNNTVPASHIYRKEDNMDSMTVEKVKKITKIIEKADFFEYGFGLLGDKDSSNFGTTGCLYAEDGPHGDIYEIKVSPLPPDEKGHADIKQKIKPIDENNKMEFIGGIIDIFEDFLEEKGIRLDNPEIDEAIERGDDPETIAIIYGSDYDSIRENLEDMLEAKDSAKAKDIVSAPKSLAEAIIDCVEQSGKGKLTGKGICDSSDGGKKFDIETESGFYEVSISSPTLL